MSLMAVSASACMAEPESFSVMMLGRTVGRLTATTSGRVVSVNHDLSDNGRGTTGIETIQLDDDGLPGEWTIGGSTTFGSKVAEHFKSDQDRATWSDASGTKSVVLTRRSIYVPQTRSPWSDALYVRVLLNAPGGELPVLPTGTLKLEQGDTIDVHDRAGRPLKVTHFDLKGIDVVPEMVLMDENKQLFAWLGPDSIIVRAGYENEEQRLRALADSWTIDRLARIERKVAHRYDAPIRIRNVWIFNPATSKLTGLLSVVVSGKFISAVEPLTSPTSAGEVLVEGDGGTLVAGMYDMHAHLQANEALLNVAAGVTSVRDMGNRNEVLRELLSKIESGAIGGPRVTRSGLIEGRSIYSENGGGIIVNNLPEALEAVRWYAARGFWQIKIYNSIHPEWVPAMAGEAHKLGLRVDGHVPAFANTDDMIKAGYDEITHINMLGFGWIQQPTDDTRTLFRLTGLKRFPSIDLSSTKVQNTLDLMVDRHVPSDPTLGIHEALTLGRDGQVPPGDVDYFDHMPVGWRRTALKSLIDTSAPGDDQAYRAAFAKILDIARLLHKRGVTMFIGTDTGGSFTYHRELQLYEEVGMTRAEIVKRATYDSAKYLRQDQTLGSVEKGKLADFFLIPGNPLTDIKAIKTIRMVVKDGLIYLPEEIYPEFSIRPFASAPLIKVPIPGSDPGTSIIKQSRRDDVKDTLGY